jgi:hypothetical protein
MNISKTAAHFSKRATRFLNNDLQTFKTFETIIAAVCISIPGFLKLGDLEYPGYRNSISAYVDMPRSYLFGMLLCMAAMLFIFNGALFFRRERKGLSSNTTGKWYNVILGVSLLLVIILPYNVNRTGHLIFAVLFFGGNALVTALFTSRKYRNIGITLAIFTIISFVFCYFKIITLFLAEWLSLTVIGIHFILQTTNVLPISVARQREMNAEK